MRAYGCQSVSEFSDIAGTDTKFDLLFELMENQKVFLSPRLTPKKLASIMRADLKKMDRYLFDNLGLSLSEVISIYRIHHSRSLLKAGIDFYDIAQFSGFRSLRRFRNCLETVLDSFS